MVTESHHFLSLNFLFLICVYVCVCAYLFILFISPFFLFLTGYLSFVEKMRIQNAENLEKENLETKHEIRTKREVNKNKIKL